MNKVRHCWWCFSRPREELLGPMVSFLVFTNACRKARTDQETHYAVTGHSEGGNDCRRLHHTLAKTTPRREGFFAEAEVAGIRLVFAT